MCVLPHSPFSLSVSKHASQPHLPHTPAKIAPRAGHIKGTKKKRVSLHPALNRSSLSLATPAAKHAAEQAARPGLPPLQGVDLAFLHLPDADVGGARAPVWSGGVFVSLRGPARLGRPRLCPQLLPGSARRAAHAQTQHTRWPAMLHAFLYSHLRVRDRG